MAYIAHSENYAKQHMGWVATKSWQKRRFARKIPFCNFANVWSSPVLQLWPTIWYRTNHGFAEIKRWKWLGWSWKKILSQELVEAKCFMLLRFLIINELKNHSNDSNKSFSECFILFWCSYCTYIVFDNSFL